MAAVLFSFGAGPQTTTLQPSAPQLSIHDLHGNVFSLAQYTGKVVVLAFWNTKCLLCIKELSALEVLNKKYGNRGLAIIAIADKNDAVSAFEIAKEMKITYPIGIGNDNNIRKLYGIREFPSIVVIGRDRRIYSKHNEYTPAALLGSEAEELLVAKDDREVREFQPAQPNTTTESVSSSEPENNPVTAEIAQLDPVDLKTFEEDLKAIKCTCGCNQNILSCQRSGMKCQVRAPVIQTELNKIKANHRLIP